MAVLQVKGTQAFMAKLRKDKARIEGKVARVHRNLIAGIFTDLVKNSPQWSGNLASQWQITYAGMPAVYNPIPDYYLESSWGSLAGANPYKMGDNPAVSATLARELAKLPLIKYNHKVVITNPTPYASDVEAGEGPNGTEIRKENHLESYGGVAMLGYVEHKYRDMRGLKRFLK